MASLSVRGPTRAVVQTRSVRHAEFNLVTPILLGAILRLGKTCTSAGAASGLRTGCGGIRAEARRLRVGILWANLRILASILAPKLLHRDLRDAIQLVAARNPAGNAELTLRSTDTSNACANQVIPLTLARKWW